MSEPTPRTEGIAYKPRPTAFQIFAPDSGDPLLTIYSDGRWEFRDEVAPTEAAQVFVREVRRLVGSHTSTATADTGLRERVEAVVADSCHHCGRLPEADGDHSCLCPLSHSECLTHTTDPVASLEAIREALDATAAPPPEDKVDQE